MFSDLILNWTRSKEHGCFFSLKVNRKFQKAQQTLETNPRCRRNVKIVYMAYYVLSVPQPSNIRTFELYSYYTHTVVSTNCKQTRNLNNPNHTVTLNECCTLIINELHISLCFSVATNKVPPMHATFFFLLHPEGYRS